MQLLRVRFLGFIKCCLPVFNLYNLVLYTPFTPSLFTPPPRFPPFTPPVFLHVYTPYPVFLSVYTFRLPPASLRQPSFAFAPFMGGYFLVDFGGRRFLRYTPPPPTLLPPPQFTSPAHSLPLFIYPPHLSLTPPPPFTWGGGLGKCELMGGKVGGGGGGGLQVGRE